MLELGMDGSARLFLVIILLVGFSYDNQVAFPLVQIQLFGFVCA
jgi:hypothetical protein